MTFKRLLNKIDQKICAYLGMDREELSARAVKMVVGELVVVHTSSFKRHAVALPWKDYVRHSVEKAADIQLEKLGAAAGKAIAKKLVISFEEVKLKIE